MASSLSVALLLCLSWGLWNEAAGQSRSRCPSGYTQYGRRCFLFMSYQRDWAAAERICISYGGNLASIHTSNELNFLKHFVRMKIGSYERTWVGGFDAAKEGLWLWSDGSRFTFSRWGSREPSNNGGKEHCMEINLKGSEFHVNDEACSRSSYFICARDL